MDSPFSIRLLQTVTWLLSLVAANEYEQLEALYMGARPGSHDIEQALKEYRTVQYAIPPHNEIADLVYYVEAIRAPTPAPSWRVAIDLYTVEEGRSDLTMQVIIADSGNKLFELKIIDLHVL